ncbi:hypothetical protein BDP55DRAFT_183546 [Colletotrichum godetiae]|uniref:Uncharacterized protein n=1 Tax=Colletotrichum godetiae TaxID=1209918 RepID=A0AAJ0AI79_9PEZI|nr:uncharacterized protein BDP55DRAFT_183546 [Colletotrichum godetiae]KAK1674366.1 hypothetical protein BDP55DRAFT_183546 [Colletotrichum godetiae]
MLSIQSISISSFALPLPSRSLDQILVVSIASSRINQPARRHNRFNVSVDFPACCLRIRHGICTSCGYPFNFSRAPLDCPLHSKVRFCFLFPSFDPQLLVSLTRCLSHAAQDLFSNRPVQEATRLPSATIIVFQPTPSPRCLDAAATRRGCGWGRHHPSKPSSSSAENEMRCPNLRGRTPFHSF